MKTALLTAINQPLELAEIESTALQFGQVLVKVNCSGICGAQMQEIKGEKGTHFPRLMGHEGSGIVQEVGVGVRTVKAGDKVVMHWRKGDGIESLSPAYTLAGKTITGGQVSTFSEYSICSENRVTNVPHGTPDDLCSLLGCGLSTAFGTIETEAKLMMGETILIIGCGGLGLNLILAAKMRQASHISAVDKYERKMQEAINMGAHQFGVSPRMMREKYDVIIDTTGHPDVFRNSLPLLASAGRFVMVGQPMPYESTVIENARHLFDGEGKTIMATQGGRFQPSRDIPRYVALWQAGLLNLDGIITHRIPLENINEGISLVKNGQAGRVLVTM